MNIVNDLKDSAEEDVWFQSIKVEYSQELDCTQLIDDYKNNEGQAIGLQVLKLEGIDGGGGKFFRLTTDSSGWSFSNIDELVQILNHFNQKAEIC